MEQNNKHTSQNGFAGIQEIEPAFDLHHFINRYILRYGLLFAFSLALALTGAYLYLRYSIYQYQVFSKLLIRDSGAGSPTEENMVLGDMNFFNSTKNLQNEMEILLSHTLMQEVVEQLRLHIEYIGEGRIKDRELYRGSPFWIDSVELKRYATDRQVGINVLNDRSFEWVW